MFNRKNLSRIKCIVAQVDGVLTDGKTWLNHQGHKQRKFSVRDSMAIRRLLKAGYAFAVVFRAESALDEKEISEHYRQLGVKHIVNSNDLSSALRIVFEQLESAPQESVFVGSDKNFGDLDFGFTVSVAGSPQEVRTSVEHVTVTEAGEGALAELTQIILDHGWYSSNQISSARKAVNS